ncbi:MAG TPA: tetratricopeptide repeat protein [Xanthobacteraceae bacterium]|jgi:predicted TPR repeat methyltransferase
MNRKARRAADASAAKTSQQFFAAVAHHQAGRLAEAERLYRALAAGGAPLAEAHNNLGYLLHQRGDVAGALSEYRKAVALKPTDPGALTNLGNTLRDLDNAAEAEACYRRALSVKPDLPEANNNLGMLLSDAGQHDQALAHYRKALAVNPANIDALNNSAAAVRRQGKTDEAIALWKQAVLQKPDGVEAHVYLADTLADRGALEEARAHALVADALVLPPRAAVRYALGIALARCGLPAPAIARLRQCAQVDPQDRYGARLALAALDQEPVPQRVSDAFIDRHYAICADRWDDAGGAYLYRGAQLVVDQVGGAGLDILDAGCGTGLVGALVRDRARRLVGVDLSAAMLALAKAKSVYDELHKSDLIAFMRARPLAFDVVTCAATLIHFGDLAPAFAATAATLRASGNFVFTVFPHERDDGFAVAALDGLGQGGCFVHGRGYIARTATANGLGVQTIESAVHEYKNGRPITCLVVVLRKA